MHASSSVDRALIVTAIPLSEHEIEHVSERIAQKTGSTYVVDVKVDPEVLGGLRIRIGDTLMDLTVRARLDSLRGFLKGRAT